MRYWLAAIPILLAACSALDRPAPIVGEASRGWRVAATPADRERLRDWRKSFVSAREAAIRAGHAADLAREGPLLDPDAAISGGTIPNGDYRCRVIKLGAQAESLLNYISYPPYRCRIAPHPPMQSFAKLTGSQRHVGIIFPQDQMRQVFLGTLVLGDEPAALPYGQDQTRNVAGYFERIGPARWRLVLPRPNYESQLDVLELIPLT